MKYSPVGVGEIELNTIILDLNGTLAVRGKVVPGVEDRIAQLKKLGFTIYLFTGDQRGNAAVLAEKLGIHLEIASTADEKQALAMRLDSSKTVGIGNARIDLGVFKVCKIRIGTLQSEGIHTAILQHIDILVPSVCDALDLLIDPDMFCATMRT